MGKKKTKSAQVVLNQGTDLNTLFGDNRAHLKRIEAKIGVTIKAENLTVTIIQGDYKQCQAAKKVIEALETAVNDGGKVTDDLIDNHITRYYETALDPNQKQISPGFNGASLVLKSREITPRTPNQKAYLQGMFNHTVSFGIGEAGTGKTFLAVAAAVDAYERGECKKIILCRPAVEAGENLGFMPGTKEEKIDPYFRPIYDALEELLPNYKNLVSSGTIEIAPLAFMRGRSLKDSFIILDEAQNTKQEQMRMFLTRLHTNSKMVITGDITQIDLPGGAEESGLVQALAAQEGVEGVFIQRFTGEDIQRHEMVGKMLDGYKRLAEREKAAPAAPEPS